MEKTFFSGFDSWLVGFILARNLKYYIPGDHSLSDAGMTKYSPLVRTVLQPTYERHVRSLLATKHPSTLSSQSKALNTMIHMSVRKRPSSNPLKPIVYLGQMNTCMIMLYRGLLCYVCIGWMCKPGCEWVFYVSVLCECFMWVFYVGVLCECFMWVFYVSVLCECFMWVFYVSVLC